MNLIYIANIIPGMPVSHTPSNSPITCPFFFLSVIRKVPPYPLRPVSHSHKQRFIEENNAFKIQSRHEQNSRSIRRGPPLEVMQFWGKRHLPPHWTHANSSRRSTIPDLISLTFEMEREEQDTERERFKQ